LTEAPSLPVFCYVSWFFILSWSEFLFWLGVWGAGPAALPPRAASPAGGNGVLALEMLLSSAAIAAKHIQ